MNPEDYVSYPVALALKKRGFDEPCDKWIASKSFSYYDEDECCDHNAVIRKGWLISQKQKERYDQEALPYLTLWQAHKWLREKKGIAINVIAHGCHEKYREGKYHWEEIHLPNSNEKGPQWVDWFIYGKHPLFDTYEEALSDGMLQMLELIEKKGE